MAKEEVKEKKTKSKPEKKPVEKKTKEEKPKEVKPEKKEKKKPVEKPAKEEIHKIKLSKAYDTPRKRRVKAVMTIIRDYVKKHKRKEAIITPELNSVIMERSIENPPRKIKVKLVEKEKVFVYPAS